MKVIALIAALSLTEPMQGGVVSSGFGYRESLGGLTEYAFHNGVDYVGPLNCPILAAADGYVREVWPYNDGHPIYGHMVVIQHGEYVFTLYGHLSEITVWEGDFVARGKTIGYQGNSGLSTGPHLHFQILIDPSILIKPLPDPLDVLCERFGLYARQARTNIVR